MAKTAAKRTSKAAKAPTIADIVRDLERQASAKFRADMPTRYGIVTKDRVFGTPMGKLKAIAKPLGHDHDLAEKLWRTKIFDARMLATMVDEPERVTPVQMDRWVKESDNWAIVDTLCFNLFDRTPHIFAKVKKWAAAKPEFTKRAAFALLACAALHGRGEDKDFLSALPLIESGAQDERNFVKKGVSWALRGIGGRSAKLNAASKVLAQRLAASDNPAARWIGKDALREFASPALAKRLARKKAKGA